MVWRAGAALALALWAPGAGAQEPPTGPGPPKAPEPNPAPGVLLRSCADDSLGAQVQGKACEAALAIATLTPTERRAALVHRGMTELQGASPAGADSDFAQAVKLGAGEGDLLDARCRGLALSGRMLSAAQRACDAVVARRPGNAFALGARGMVELKLRRFQPAWTDYDAAARLEPATMEWRLGRGAAALKLGRTAEGQADIRAAEAGRPGITAEFAGYGVKVGAAP